jgi:hypothetical protein
LQSDIFDRSHKIDGTAQNAKLFLRADDQVAQGQHGLQAFSHPRIQDKAVLAEILRGQSPQHRPIVHVEYHPAPGCLDPPRSTQARCEHAGRRQVCAVDQHGLRRGEQRMIEIELVERHVGAVFAIEDERKGFAIANSEHDQGGQALGIGVHAPHIHALAHEFFANESPHVIGADTSQESRS